jgi:ABC-type transport system involved in multi-copper enzyme maturation permease subunit
MNLYQSSIPIGRESFGQLVRAEWTKLRSVRGWRIAMFLAFALTVALAITVVSGRSQGTVNGVVAHPHVAAGPGGEPVTDTFFFVQQPLTGNGTITARVTSLGAPSLATTVCTKSPGRLHCTAAREPGGPPGFLAPWAKAGLIVKASDTEGSAYAAVMVTPAHGVRMQWNYVNDVAGDPGAVSARSPRWLRLTRSGEIITGYDSTDGRNWSEIDTVRLGGLAATVDIGLFVTSPQLVTVIRNGGLGGTVGGAVGSVPSFAQATIDFVNLDHAGAARTWHGIQVGGNGLSEYPSVGGGYDLSPAGIFTIAGSGDIAPAAIGGPGGTGQPIDITLVGGFLGLLVLIMLGTVFITDEYRRGLIRTTLAASPRRGRVLAAKAVVVGAVSFVVGALAATVCVTVGGSLLRSQGNLVYTVSALSEVRMIVGAGAVLAVGAVMALALGTVFRHGAGVIVGLLALFVLPEFLSVGQVLPAAAGEWLLRLTPAAGFAVEQSLQAFPQVSTFYWPQYGYYPLPEWGGFLVLCAYAAAALALASYLLGRRDA